MVFFKPFLTLENKGKQISVLPFGVGRAAEVTIICRLYILEETVEIP